jgi:flavin reductase (DIM6/NTAB) family NADH-FMN oxidoreductase RutF
VAIDPRSLSPQDTYRLMTGIVVPRPIAWVTSLSASGVVNLAPFSAFTFLSMKPALLGINIGRRSGQRKDTANNIQRSGEYVVHIGDGAQMHAIHESSAEHPPDISEVDLLGLPTLPGEQLRVPRLADAPVAMECRLQQVIPFGRTGSEFFVGEVIAIHARDGLVRDGKIESKTLDPVCRLAGPNYATLGDIVTLRGIAQAPKSMMLQPFSSLQQEQTT